MKSKTDQTNKNDTTQYRVWRRFTILQVMTVVGILGVLIAWLIERFF